ncbi:MAG TPA: hypothetical protein VHL11_19065 [Phototrophicaceae bacterium]|nr:hypothetical protein [Phototrophicaceae bacterium]
MDSSPRYQPDRAATHLMIAFAIGLLMGMLCSPRIRRGQFGNVIVTLNNSRFQG